MPPKKGSRPKRASQSPNSVVQKRKRMAASSHKTKPKRRRTEGSSTNAASLTGPEGSNTETVLQTLVKSMSEMQKQIKCLQEGRQPLSNLAGAPSATYVPPSKIPQNDAEPFKDLSGSSQDTNNTQIGTRSSEEEAELLDILPTVTKGATDVLTGKGILQAGLSTSANNMLGNLDTDLVASSNISLGSMVKPSIKSAIWANKYVDLSLLLAPELQLTYELVCDQPDLEVDDAPQLRWTQKKAMSIKHIQQWTDAFQMFISIYCLRFPAEASNLMKYMATVRNIAKKKGDWAQYDVKFRKLRELQPSLGWEVFHSELYHEARLEFVGITSSSYRQENVNNKRGRSRVGYDGKSNDRYRYNSQTSWFNNSRPFMERFGNSRRNNWEKPYGANAQYSGDKIVGGRRPFRRDESPCWRYNRGKYCWGCSRPHSCSYCRADHPRRDCPILSIQNDHSPSSRQNTNKAKHPKKDAK